MAGARPISRLFAIAEEALQLGPSRRAAYLESTCGTDVELLRQVEALLEAERKAGSFLETPAVFKVAEELLGPAVPAAFQGQRIGPYRIERPLGAGGVGEVFLAVRADDQFDQRVAIKVLRDRLSNDDARRRILAERRILARLEHPHIARLYGGGTTEDGRPYLVMEYVEGEPIDTYCGSRELRIDARLELFEALCSAVQFAHRSLVVHRDLKPSNILVTADGTPKLLDFSIAKAIYPGRDLSQLTSTGTLPMTLAYASPEQILGEPVTAATDVHGLGIILYLLLTDRHPFTFDDQPLHAVAEAICAQRPTPPSRVPGASRVADLDAIVLKALEKDPDHRYPSVDQLLADLERYRRRLPILARPPSLGYRWRKAVSRHRPLFLLAGVAGLLITAFVLALIAQSRRAHSQAERARREAASAEEVADFLVSVISVRPDAAAAREMLDWGRQRARDVFAGRPESQGRLFESIGAGYRQIGSYDAAAEVLDEALELRSEVYGPRSSQFAETLRHQAQVLMDTGDLAAAERLMLRALDIARESSGPGTPELADALHFLSSVTFSQGRFRDAERYSREALSIRRAHFGDLDGAVVNSLNNLAISLYQQGVYDEAEELLREAITLRERFQGPEHPGMAVALTNLAELYSTQGRIEDAETLYLKSVAITRGALGSDHPRMSAHWHDLGSLYLDSGRLEEAEEALKESRRITAAAVSPKHPWSIQVTMTTARLRREQGELAQAEELGLRAHGDAGTFLGTAHPLTAQSAESHAETLARLGRAEESRRWLAEAYEDHLAAHGEHHPEVKRFCGRHPAACPRRLEAAPALVTGAR